MTHSRYLVIGGNWFALENGDLVTGPMLTTGGPDFETAAVVDPDDDGFADFFAYGSLVRALELTME